MKGNIFAVISTGTSIYKYHRNMGFSHYFLVPPFMIFDGKMLKHVRKRYGLSINIMGVAPKMLGLSWNI